MILARFLALCMQVKRSHIDGSKCHAAFETMRRECECVCVRFVCPSISSAEQTNCPCLKDLAGLLRWYVRQTLCFQYPSGLLNHPHLGKLCSEAYFV
jgi:hypothetical protein